MKSLKETYDSSVNDLVKIRNKFLELNKILDRMNWFVNFQVTPSQMAAAIEYHNKIKATTSMLRPHQFFHIERWQKDLFGANEDEAEEQVDNYDFNLEDLKEDALLTDSEDEEGASY